MGNAVRKTLVVQEGGRIEVVLPEFVAGDEVEAEFTRKPTKEEALAAFDRLAELGQRIARERNITDEDIDEVVDRVRGRKQ